MNFSSRSKKLACCLVPACILLASDLSLAAQPGHSDITSTMLRGSLFVLGLVTIVFIFYKPVYGLLVRYYHPDYCRQVVLSMLLLYLLGWLSLSAYIIFDVGFMYYWVKWVFIFLGALWLIAFAVIMVRSSSKAC